LLRITEDHHPALRLTEPLRGLLDAGAQSATELAEVRGNEVDWLGPSVHNSENVRVILVTGPGQLGIEGRVTTSRYTLETLKAQPGVEVIAAPRITTLSGRAAQIEVAEVATVLTGIHPQAVVQPGDSPRAIRDPYTAVSVPLGLVLEAHPELADDHDTIDLRLTATIAEFVGYDATPPEQQIEVWENGEAVWIDPPEPRLRVREVTALAQLQDGETLVLGSWPSPRKDRAPSPGDSPREESTSTPPLLILLTPTVLDDDGFPLRPRERQPRNSRVDQP
jgi:hypothetical protein